MSVWISAIMGHNWPRFSKAIVDEVSEAASLQPPLPRYQRIYNPKSRRHEIANDGSEAFVLPGDFSIRLGRQILELRYSHRWGRLLMYKTVRTHFMAACRRVGSIAGGREALVLPEGTVLADSLVEDVTFAAIKERALTLWGSPDLDVARFLTKAQANRMPFDRVHYFIVPFVNERG